jgi:hypothetical protein
VTLRASSPGITPMAFLWKKPRFGHKHVPFWHI